LPCIIINLFTFFFQLKNLFAKGLTTAALMLII